jgi:hypothetical protein
MMVALAFVSRASCSAEVHASGSRFAAFVGPNTRFQGNESRPYFQLWRGIEATAPW